MKAWRFIRKSGREDKEMLQRNQALINFFALSSVRLLPQAYIQPCSHLIKRLTSHHLSLYCILHSLDKNINGSIMS